MSITEVSIITHEKDGSHARHVSRDNEKTLEMTAWSDSRNFVISVISNENALAVEGKYIVLSREEFKVLREHVNDPDVLKMMGM